MSILYDYICTTNHHEHDLQQYKRNMYKNSQSAHYSNFNSSDQYNSLPQQTKNSASVQQHNSFRPTCKVSPALAPGSNRNRQQQKFKAPQQRQQQTRQQVQLQVPPSPAAQAMSWRSPISSVPYVRMSQPAPQAPLLPPPPPEILYRFTAPSQTTPYSYYNH